MSETDPDIGYSKGYIPRDYDTDPLGGSVYAARFSMPLIDPATIKERIAEKTANKSWIKDVIQRAGMKPKNQNPFGWCHAAGLVQAAQINYLLAGFPFMELSIASVAGPVTGWRDVGANIFSDLKVAKELGIAETKVFVDVPRTKQGYADPASAKRAYTDEVKQNALKHRVNAEDLDTHNQLELITCCLENITTVLGITDWSHCTTGPVKLHWVEKSSDPIKNVVLEPLNNWGDWSADARCHADHGYYMVPYGGYHQPAEAYAIYSIM